MRDALFARLSDHASCIPDRPAVTSNGVLLTFADLASRITSAGAELRRAGIKAGNVVAICTTDAAVGWVLVLALLHEGVTVCPLNPIGAGGTPDFGPDAVLADPEQAPLMRRVFPQARILLVPDGKVGDGTDRDPAGRHAP